MDFQVFKNQAVQLPARLKSNLMHGARVLLVIVSAVAVFCLLISFARIGIGAWLYTSVEDWVTIKLGFDYYLANLAATLAVVVGTLVLPGFAWYLVTGRGKLYGALVPIGGWLAMWLLVSTLGASVCFDRRTGAPLCYFCDTPQGRVWSRTSGFEPKTGRAFTLYTREIYEREQHRQPQICNSTPAAGSANANLITPPRSASNSNRNNNKITNSPDDNSHSQNNLKSTANRAPTNSSPNSTSSKTNSDFQITDSATARTDTPRSSRNSAAEAERLRIERERIADEQLAREQAAARLEHQREEQSRRDRLAQQERDEAAHAERERQTRERAAEQRRQEAARRRSERERQIFGIANRAIGDILRRRH